MFLAKGRARLCFACTREPRGSRTRDRVECFTFFHRSSLLMRSRPNEWNESAFEAASLQFVFREKRDRPGQAEPRIYKGTVFARRPGAPGYGRFKLMCLSGPTFAVTTQNRGSDSLPLESCAVAA